MKHNVFIVLGGGLNADGSLPEFVQNRVDWIINKHSSSDIILFSALYSLNVPPKLSKEGFPLSEAHQMAKYFAKKEDVNVRYF